MSQSQNLTIDQAIVKAKKATKKGSLEEASHLYQSILKHQPNHPLAKKLFQKLKKTSAYKKINYPDQKSPPQQQINELIDIYHIRNYVKVEIICLALLRKYPESFILLSILGSTLNELGKYFEAITIFEKSIKLKDKQPETYYNHGIALSSLGFKEKALTSFSKAVKIKPNYTDAYSNRGNIYYALGQLDNALTDYNKTISLNPDYVMAYFNRGIVLRELGKFEESLKSYDKAHLLRPNHANTYCNQGVVYKDMGLFSEALNNYNKAIKINPNHIEAYSNRCVISNFNPDLSTTEVFDIHISFEKQFAKLEENKNLSKRPRNKRIRVAYLSPDFRSHSVAYFFQPLLKAHDTTKIEVFCYYNHTQIDSITKNIEDLSEHWTFIKHLTDEEVVELIKKDNIDILVDLAGHTGNNRLNVFTYKPAPIQLTWLGYPNTTGLKSLDYRFTDNIADPIGNSDSIHSEELIRLPNGFLCYQGDESVPESSELPCIKNEYITFGSFNNLSKVNHKVIKLWSEILLAIPNSKLLLKSKQFSDTETKNRYLAMFKHQGINEHQLQIYTRLEDNKEHLLLYNNIDISLDPFPYNGTTTTCEALWMGVPTITLKGDRHASRVGASIMARVDLEEFIAENKEYYLEMAIKLSKNKEKLSKIRASLRQKIKESVLCDSQLFAKNIEEEYFKMRSIHKL